MSTSTPNLGLFKYDPNTDGAQTFNIQKALNENWDKVDAAVKNLSSAAEYSAAQTYALGDYCTHDGKLYRCTTAITKAEAWTDAHWTETSVSAELKAIYTTLQKKAPAGYGLGASSKNVTDWNNEKTNGWVRDSSGTEDKHSPFVGLFSVGLVSDYAAGEDAFQLAFSRNQYAKTRTYIKFRAYNSDDKVWGEWEWVNPPMQLGVEYRTTERYLGKPVYVKAVNVSVLPSAGSYVIPGHGIANLGYCVECSGSLENGTSIPYVNTSKEGQILLGVNSNNIRLYSDIDLSALTAVVRIKYTKTTD